METSGIYPFILMNGSPLGIHCKDSQIIVFVYSGFHSVILIREGKALGL